jgi:hypothetical protein
MKYMLRHILKKEYNTYYANDVLLELLEMGRRIDVHDVGIKWNFFYTTILSVNKLQILINPCLRTCSRLLTCQLPCTFLLFSPS